MNISTKLLKAAAGQAGGAGLDVDEVFSTDLWTSDGSSTQTITNNIDLSNEGGLVWIKDRSTARANVLVDTARISGNTDNYLMSDSTNAQTAHSNEFGDFTSTGYTFPRNTEAGYTNTNTGRDYVGWTFRKAPKFFDVVKITGTGGGNRAINHALGSVPGMIIGTRYDVSGENWFVYHRGVNGGSSPENYGLQLNNTYAQADESSYWQDTAPTSTQFTVGNNLNHSGGRFIFYLIGHHANDGSETGFGPNGDSPCISCGSYTGAGSPYTGGSEIDLGFEPQFVLIKSADHSKNWVLIDNMRGWEGVGGKQNWLYPNTTGADNSGGTLAYLTSTGFKPYGSSFTNHTGTFIYMAVRRGSLNVPTDPTKVFHAEAGSNSSDFTYNAGFAVDMMIYKERTTINTGWGFTWDRLRGSNYLRTNDTNAETEYTSSGNPVGFDEMTFVNVVGQTTNDKAIWNWKRAKGYFDIVTYSGSLGATNFSGTTSINHQLGVKPEIIWIKSRSNTPKWCVGSTHFSSGGTLALNETAALEGVGNTDRFVYADWSSTVFKVGNNDEVNRTGYTYIAYLFATLAGISKCGTCSHTFGGGDTNVDCGFSNGCRFLLIKSTTHTYNWEVYDSVRGIVSGNDPYLKLNTTDAEVTNNDGIDPLSSGFTLTSTGWNTGTYIFYAIA